MRTDSSGRRDPLTDAPIVVRMTYDTLNRLVTRIAPTVQYAKESCGVGCPGMSQPEAVINGPFRFPYFTPPRVAGFVDTNVVLLSDTARFAYDRAGNLRTADNRDAKIYREYFPNGALRLDSLRIAVYDRTVDWGVDPYSKHEYGLRYTYDVSGRLASRSDQVPGFFGNSQSYGYEPGSGLLTTSTDQGATATFRYDAAGRLGQWGVGSAFTETRGYDDDDDELITRSNPVFSDVLTYDARGKIVEAQIGRRGTAESRSMAYSALGALGAVSRTRGSTLSDEYSTDGFGNVLVRDANRGTQDLHRRYGSNVQNGEQLVSTDVTAPSAPTDGSGIIPGGLQGTTYGYDQAGNQILAITVAQKAVPATTPVQFEASHEGSSQSRSYYDGENHLRLYQESGFFPVGSGYPRVTTVAEYRYDALGRRVLLRTLRDSLCASDSNGACQNTNAKLATIERFVWDGSQILYEYRTEGGIFATANELEDGVVTSSALQGSVHYFHAGGIDQPLAVWRDGAGQGFVPHLSWRGAFEEVSRLDGTNPGIYLAASDADAYMGSDVNQAVRLENYWLGSVVSGKADVSGLMYMRNRYYDPKAARFTQEDPIGLAGGMNLYGFGGGDPVNFSDPFGTCPEEQVCPEEWARQKGRELLNTVGDFGNSLKEGLKSAGRELMIQGGIALATGSIGVEAEGVGAFVRIAGPAREGMQVTLQEFFGQAAAGAERRLASRTLTPGVTREMLGNYMETVARPILDGTAALAQRTARAVQTQAARSKLIEEALKYWPK